MTQAHKTEIERRILKEIINALENEKIAEAELPDIADFVITHIDPVQNHDQMIKFLDELSLKWTFFRTLAQLERNEVSEAKEDQVEEQVLKLAKSGNVTEAINLAKTATEK